MNMPFLRLIAENLKGEELFSTLGKTFIFKDEEKNKKVIRCALSPAYGLELILVMLFNDESLSEESFDKAFVIDMEGQAFSKDEEKTRMEEYDVVFLTEEEIRANGIKFHEPMSRSVKDMPVDQIDSELRKCYDFIDSLRSRITQLPIQNAPDKLSMEEVFNIVSNVVEKLNSLHR